MTHTSITNKLTFLLGGLDQKVRVLPVYSEMVCDFLDEVSRELRNDKEAKAYPDVISFAFWCRRGNIQRLKEAYPGAEYQVGRGTAFHVAPSNVPINFAFSLAFGLLSGNGNVVRVSEKDFPQTHIVCDVMKRILDKEEYRLIREQLLVVSYGHDKEINDYFSSICDVRIIWGGDRTIEEIRKSPLSSRATEITFADRYSFAYFDERSMEGLSEEEWNRLAEGFYNDTYLMDQNACSSPHLVLWKPSRERRGRIRFWEKLAEAAEKYDLAEKKVMDKYTQLCELAAQEQGAWISKVDVYSNLLYVAQLHGLPDDICGLRGRFGMFFEGEIGEERFLSGISSKVQTCVTFGIDQKEFAQTLVDQHVLGVDRIVHVGSAMDIGTYWDGYDVIGTLSRRIEIQ